MSQSRMSTDPIPNPTDGSPMAGSERAHCETVEVDRQERDKKQIPTNASPGQESEVSPPAVPGKPRNAPRKEPADKTRNSERLISVTEQQAYRHAKAIMGKVKLKNAKFLQDEEGRFYIRLDGKTILLDESPDSQNLALDQLLMTRFLPGTASPAGKFTVRYLRILVADETKDLSLMCRFSALSKDEKRLYVPTNSGLLQISSSGIKSKVKNGDNADRVVVEPADGQQLFDFLDADPKERLALFEELVVNAQAVVEPAMAWRLAMQSVLFPFIRAAYQDRYIPMHFGSSQSGKSSGARWFSSLLGFDDLRGDYTPAAIRAAGDTGIFFLDNREQRNLSRELQDLLLFAATGGESGRSNPTGGLRKSKARPIISLTSIEGPEIAELKNRCIMEFFALTKARMKPFSPKEHLQRIKAERSKIMSALMFVLQRFLKIQAENPLGGREPVPDGAARFQDNYRAVCNLLRAFAEVAHKPDAWSTGIIDAWNRSLSTVEVPSERLDFLIRRFIEEKLADQVKAGGQDYPLLTAPELREATVVYRGTHGTLYVTNYATLLDWGKERDSHSFPRTSQALSSRLDEIDSPSFRVIRESDAKGDPMLEKLLKHKESVRFVGFFRPDRADGS